MKRMSATARSRPQMLRVAAAPQEIRQENEAGADREHQRERELEQNRSDAPVGQAARREVQSRGTPKFRGLLFWRRAGHRRQHADFGLAKALGDVKTLKAVKAGTKIKVSAAA